MSPDQILEVAPLLALILLAFALLFLLLSFSFFRRSRKDVFWRRRRAAGQQGWRSFLLSGTLLVFSAILCTISVVAPRLLQLREPATTITDGGTQIGLNPTADLTLTAIFALPTTAPPIVATVTTAATSATPDGFTTTPPSSPMSTEIAPTQVAQTPTLASPSATPVTPTDQPTMTPLPPSASPLPTLTAAPPSATPTASRTVPPTAIPTMTTTPTITATASATRTATATDTVTASATATRTATPTATPSATFTVTASATPSPTATPSATATVTETWVPIIQAASITSKVTPSAAAAVSITALDDQISAANAPVTPTTQLPAGATRVYFFVQYAAMTPGMLWRRELWLNGVVIQQGSFLWGQAQAGTAFFYFGQQDGFAPGEYDIRLYIGDDTAPIATAAFSVQ